MKDIVYVIGVFALVVVVQAVSRAGTEEELAKALEVHKKCVSETGVSDEEVAKVRKGDWTVDSDEFKKYCLCSYKHIGIIDDDGDFQKEVMLAHVRPLSEKAQAEKTIDECLSKPKPASVEEFSYQISKCYLEANPTHNIVP